MANYRYFILISLALSITATDYGMSKVFIKKNKKDKEIVLTKENQIYFNAFLKASNLVHNMLRSYDNSKIKFTGITFSYQEQPKNKLHFVLSKNGVPESIQNEYAIYAFNIETTDKLTHEDAQTMLERIRNKITLTDKKDEEYGTYFTITHIDDQIVPEPSNNNLTENDVMKLHTWHQETKKKEFWN